MTMVDQLGYNIRPCFIFCKSLGTKHRMIMLQQRMIICCLCFLWRMKRWSGSQARTVLQLEARTKNGCHKFAIFSVSISIIEEELDRREGKGRRCCLGEVLVCRTSHLAARMIYRIVFARTSIVGGWWFGVNQMIIHFLKHAFCQVSVLLFILFFKL